MGHHKSKKHSRRRSRSSSRYSSSSDSSRDYRYQQLLHEVEKYFDRRRSRSPTAPRMDGPVNSETMRSLSSQRDVSPSQIGPLLAESAEPLELELEAEVLQALGERPQDECVPSPPLHSKVAAWWKELLKKGLSVEERAAILQKHPAPANCGFLAPPKLNVEVQRALSDAAKLRDQRIVKQQERIVACLSCRAKDLSYYFSVKQPEILPLIERACEEARLLLDMHIDATTIRRSVILAVVNASMRDMLNTTVVDEFLFGEKLAEHIILAKQINKNADELKLSSATSKPTSTQPSPASAGVLPAGGRPAPRQNYSRQPYYRQPYSRQYRPSQRRSRSPHRRRY